MNVYDFKVFLEPDEEAGGFVISCPSLPGCYSEGDTVDEALANIKEAILLSRRFARVERADSRPNENSYR